MYKYNIIKLKNGLTIISIPNKQVDSFLLEVAAKIGAYDESLENKGISHILEHMILKETQNQTQQEINESIDSKGALKNGSTNSYRTRFYICIAKKYWKTALNILSDMYLAPKFSEKILKNEKQVILKELKREGDLNGFKTRMLINKKIFGKESPTTMSTIGNKKNVNSISQKDLQNWHKKHYIAKNTFITVAGNFDEKKVISEIKTKFSKISCLKPVKKQKITLIEPKQEIIFNKTNSKQTTLRIVFPFSKEMLKQKKCLRILKNILRGKGKTSRLYKKLRTEKGLIYSMGYDNHIDTDFGYTNIYIPTETTKVIKALDIILSELSNIKANEIDQKELKASVLNIEGRLAFENDSFYNFVKRVKTSIIKKGKFTSSKEKLIKYKKITTKEIQKTAQKLFDFNKVKIAIEGDFDTTKMRKEIKNVLKNYKN